MVPIVGPGVLLASSQTGFPLHLFNSSFGLLVRGLEPRLGYEIITAIGPLLVLPDRIDHLVLSINPLKDFVGAYH